MANHVRRQIRDAAKALLTGLATTGARVFTSRVYPIQDSELPALVISTNDEQIDVASIGAQPLLDRLLQLQVRALAKANSALDDTLDACIKEVEIALNASVSANTLSGLAKRITISSIYIDMSGEGEKPIGQAVMNFNVYYKTQANTPDVSI